MQLADRVAVVTGSDSGIGQATAIEFAMEGADVVVTYNDDRRGADETAAQVEKAGLTPFNQKAIDDPKVLEEQVQSIPLKRAAEPREIARLAVYLASADADYVHGATVYIDGGLMQNQGQGA